jgi:hypothetical protein
MVPGLVSGARTLHGCRIGLRRHYTARPYPPSIQGNLLPGAHEPAPVLSNASGQ